jgi:4-hydroxy-tetrahydrodipicolinate reductase
MKIRIGLIGSTGKTGQQVSICAKKNPKIDLVWEINSQSSRSNLNSIDAIIDFSSPLALEENIALAQTQKVPIVIGTTGLENHHRKMLENASKQIPIFWAPNFSLGIAILVRAIEILSPLLQKNFLPHITETHHIHKKDSPSGSALALANATLEGYQTLPPIKSIRLQEVIGEHAISFLGKNEEITFIHKTHSRELFAEGALQAAAFILHKPPNLYGMNDLLD